jgi:hypothetical protein
MKDLLTAIVLQQKAKERITLPIKYWECWSKKTNGSPYQLVDSNNSIKILRNKYGKNFIYRAIR